MATIFDDAYLRGWQRGIAERREGCAPSSLPLSEDWADESFSELVGDLVGERCPDTMTYDEIIRDLCDEYNRGYFDAFEEEEEELS